MSNKKKAILDYSKKQEIINRFNPNKLGYDTEKLTKSHKSTITRLFNDTVKNHIPAKKYQTWAASIRKFETFHSPKRKNFSQKDKLKLVETWEDIKHFNKLKVIKVTAKQKRELEKRGFKVVEKGVLVDELRDNQGRQIKNSNVKLLKSGIIKESVGKRKIKTKKGTLNAKGQTTYIVTFSTEEKANFIKSPHSFIESLLKKYPELKNKFKPSDFNRPGKKKLSLQVGQYGSRSYSISRLDHYITEAAENENVNDRYKMFLNNVTGVRLTIYS